MRFHSQINGVDAEQFSASDPRAAVDAARAALKAPDEGGDFAIIVISDDPWTDSAGVHDPGPVSDFAVHYDPAPHLREEVSAREAEAENAAIHAAYRAAVRAEILAEMEAEKSK